MKLNIKSIKIENMTIKNIESYQISHSAQESRITICWENKVITCNLSDVEIEVE